MDIIKKYLVQKRREKGTKKRCDKWNIAGKTVDLNPTYQ